MDEVVLKTIEEIDGWLFKEEAELLNKYSTTLTNKDFVLELGSYKGKSTLALAYDSDAVVYCVDTFNSDNTTVAKADTLSAFLKNVSWLANVRPIVASTEQAKVLQDFELLPPEFKLIFIDADHRYEAVNRDFARFEDSVPAGGIVIFHDAYGENGEERNTPWPGVTQFVKELERNTDWKLVEKCRRCAVFKRLV